MCKIAMHIDLIAVLIFYAVLESESQRNCYNPNRRSGECVSIFTCSSLLNLIISNPIGNEDRRFLVESQCEDGEGEPPYVCCNTDTGFISGPISRSISSSGNGRGHIIPAAPICGVQGIGNEISRDSNSEVESTFPWLALLMYVSDSGQISGNCGGSLINTRYVLTAAHCIHGATESTIGPLYSVRLGINDLSRDVFNCSSTTCNGSIEFGIEEVIPHELFEPNSKHRYHDIALIRLSRDVVYSSAIRPICLPATLSFHKSLPGQELSVAGWGISIQGNKSSLKQHLNVPVLGRAECNNKLLPANITIIDSQVCTGANHSCFGDSGGPLMTFAHNYWLIEGVSSFNDFCGTFSLWPQIYTRVSGYGNWLRRHMRP